MTAIAPTSPVAGAPPVGGGPVAVAAPAGITNLPPGLANLTAGAILNGAVVGRDGQGHVLVQTPNGMLSLATALPLPQGTTLSLQIQTMGAQIQMVVLSINQQPQQPGARNVVTATAQPAGKAGTAAPPVALLLAEEPVVTVTTGRVFTATVVDSIPQAAAPPGTAPQAAAPQSGGPQAAGPETLNPALSARASAAVLPDAQPILASLLGRAPRESGDTTSQKGGRPPGAPAHEAGETALPKGSRMTVSVAALDTDPTSDPKTLMRVTAEGRAGVKLVPGIVVEPDATGTTQVQTPIGMLALSTKIPLPAAARVVLDVMGEVELPLPVADDGEAPSVAQGRNWPTLDDALTALSRDDPAVAKRTIENVLPRAGAEMAPALMAAVTALKAGDVRGLLGDHLLKALDLAGHHDLAVRLGAEFQQLTGIVPDASGDWHRYLIPVHDGGTVHFLRFLFRRNRKNSAPGADAESPTRFIVEVDMSRLGAMQFDGLVKPKKFDLIIRSHRPLDAAMRRDIAKVFNDSLAASGHTGALSFQASPGLAFVAQRGAAPVGFNV